LRQPPLRAKYKLTAVFWTSVFAGLGQIYSDRLVRGIIIISINCSVYFLFYLEARRILEDPQANITALLLIGILTFIFFGLWVVIDACRCVNAFNSRYGHRPAYSIKRWIISLLGILLMINYGPSRQIIVYLRQTHFSIYRIAGKAMEPVLRPGDKVIVNRRIKTSQLKRGDIVVFEGRANDKKAYIIRIVGFPGETVKIEKGRLFINGEPLSDPIFKNFIYLNTGDYGIGAFIVPESSFYALGDNSGHSLDSRMIGPIAGSQIVGKVAKRILPWSRKGLIE
jgi:signal peptidase I